MTPTVGRVLHYFTSHNAEPFAAIIAKVQSDTLIAAFDVNGDVKETVPEAPLLNLTVFDENGNAQSILDVPLFESAKQAVEFLTGGGEDVDLAAADTAHCRWMPDQAGQAAKAETLQASLEAAERMISQQADTIAMLNEKLTVDIAEHAAQISQLQSKMDALSAPTVVQSGATSEPVPSADTPPSEPPQDQQQS